MDLDQYHAEWDKEKNEISVELNSQQFRNMGLNNLCGCEINFLSNLPPDMQRPKLQESTETRSVTEIVPQASSPCQTWKKSARVQSKALGQDP